MENALLESIGKMIVNGNRLELPTDEQFKNYPAVKRCLITAGSKYVKCGFVFTEDAQTVKDRLMGGEAINDKKKFQFFPTPDKLVGCLLHSAEIKETDRVLEPSAGQGAIANRIPNCVVVELMEQNIKALERQGYTPHAGDFLSMDAKTLGTFDKIIANPPFTKNQDIDHIRHMYSLLNDGGRIVSMASIGWMTGSQKKQIEFREWLNDLGADIVNISSGEFKESGTMVSTCLITINKY